MSKSQIVYLEHTSKVLAANPLNDPNIRDLPIYLPAGYDDNPSRRYPVIWVLAPFTSWGQRLFNLQAWDENIVQRMDRLVDEGKARPTILAFPDCFTRYGGSQYLNSSAIGRYEDYVTKELIPFVDSQLRTLPAREHRGVMGHSSGGYGAWVLGMRHPDLFSALASHSGDAFFEYCYWPDIPPSIRYIANLGGLEAFLTRFADIHDKSRDWGSALNLIAMSACYSPNPDSPHGFDVPCDLHTGEIRQDVWKRWLNLDPVRMASKHIKKLQTMRAIFFDCGTRDEYNLFLGARVLHRILDQENVPHTYQEFDGGHQRINWRYDVSLPALTTAIGHE
ncbi:MAG: esterase [Anaerolineae bacterium]|nr:esterase [Anaerolineae bacterium]